MLTGIGKIRPMSEQAIDVGTDAVVMFLPVHAPPLNTQIVIPGFLRELCTLAAGNQVESFCAKLKAWEGLVSLSRKLVTGGTDVAPNLE